NDCVGEGGIVEHTDETWGTTGFYLVPRRATRRFARRWAVRLDRVHVPRAKTLYPDATDPRGTPATAQLASRVDSVILWDASRLRKTTAIVTAGAAGEPAGEPAGAPAGAPAGVLAGVPAGALAGAPAAEAVGAAAGEAVRAAAEEGATSSKHVKASTVSCERGGPGGGGGKEGPRLPDSVGEADARRGAGQGGTEFVTPSEPFFCGELDGIEALSSESVACSAGSGGLADEGQAATAGGDDDEEDEVPLDVTADMPSAEVEELLFLKVAGLVVKLDTFHAMQRVSKL
ncbi:unnamed protein product, partial [Ectocarpus sp. 4 AP-2014]